MAELPAGTVTFLFTDIEGGGVEIRTEGGAFFALQESLEVADKGDEASTTP